MMTTLLSILFLLLAIKPTGSIPLGGKGGRNNKMSNRVKRSSKVEVEHYQRNDNKGSGSGGGDDDDDDNDDDHSNNQAESLSRIQVMCRDEWYMVDNVITAEDVLQSVMRQSSLKSSEVANARFICRGKVIGDEMNHPNLNSQNNSHQKKNKNIRLQDQGVQNGDRLLLVVDGQHIRPHEFLAILLDTFSKRAEESQFVQWMKQWKHLGKSEDDENGNGNESDNLDFFFLNILGPPLSNNSKQMTQEFRRWIDLGYHRLRSWWEGPVVRSTFLHHNSEIYRKVLETHLPTGIQEELSPTAQKILHDPQIWKDQWTKLATKILEDGDTMLDAFLDIVLDVVQGAGRDNETNRYQSPSLSAGFAARRPKGTESQDSYEPSMNDPNIANQMLFELSESEDD